VGRQAGRDRRQQQQRRGLVISQSFWGSKGSNRPGRFPPTRSPCRSLRRQAPPPIRPIHVQPDPCRRQTASDCSSGIDRPAHGGNRRWPPRAITACPAGSSSISSRFKLAGTHGRPAAPQAGGGKASGSQGPSPPERLVDHTWRSATADSPRPHRQRLQAAAVRARDPGAIRLG